ncbi:MAG: glycogen debranching enzyme family protein, partial [Candidatus Riflebacteria bacterium]|nr:glycogen debranching enzyme family protein [Candidatus Riflebacteria bacterium]
MTNIGREIQSDITRATMQEWLVTNGIGGYASSTLPCINTRRYHGILVASQRPPIERIVMVSRLEETLIIDGREYPLSTSIHKKRIEKPSGYLHLERFERNPLPVWYYQIRDVLVIKSLCMVYGQNTTIVTYKLLANGNDVTLKVTPHYLFRDFHGNTYENAGIKNCLTLTEHQFTLKPFANAPELHVRWDRGTFKEKLIWHKDVFLRIEEERGLPSTEDDFSYGTLEVNKFNGSVSIAFSDQPITSFNPIDLRKREEQRLEAITNSIQSNDKLLKDLLLAADQFIVDRKSTGSKTILAGYPWFSDWGRDSL